MKTVPCRPRRQAKTERNSLPKLAFFFLPATGGYIINVFYAAMTCQWQHHIPLTKCHRDLCSRQTFLDYSSFSVLIKDLKIVTPLFTIYFIVVGGHTCHGACVDVISQLTRCPVSLVMWVTEIAPKLSHLMVAALTL